MTDPRYSKAGTVHFTDGTDPLEVDHFDYGSSMIIVFPAETDAVRYYPIHKVDHVVRSQTASASTQSDTADADGGVNMDVDHDGEAMDDLAQWFVDAADFAGFDPDIIDLSWAKADGELGIAVERQPFDGGYYAEDEWQDRDAYDDHRETAGDLLSDNQHFQWYGEPDYVYFVAEEDVSEVVG